MSDKFQNKYRIPSARLYNWDYRWNAAYFVTICTAGRENYFGAVRDREMDLSEIGLLATKFWNEIPQHFPFVVLNEFVVMPNHVHGIIIIDKPNDGCDDKQNDGRDDKQNDGCDDKQNDGRDNKRNVETPNLGVSTAIPTAIPAAIPADTVIPTNDIVPTNRTAAASKKWNAGTLGVIINQYKRAVTIHARQIHADFAWQSRFHDHIIRNDESFQRIRNYIYNNPANWHGDKFYDETL